MTSILQKPRFWLVTFAAIAVAGLTFSLGQWQLRRAATKEEFQLAITAQGAFPVLDNKALFGIENTALVVHRTALLKGTWIPDQTVYLDNRPMRGHSGFIVVTPLLLEGGQKPILVQRGWVQRNFESRTNLPSVFTPPGPVAVGGRIAPAPSKLYEFKGVDGGRIRQNLDLPAFAAETGLPLLPVTLLQTGLPSEGLARDWAPPNLGVERNYGYAFQWFAMCALVVLLYVWFQVIQPLRPKKLTHQ